MHHSEPWTPIWVMWAKKDKRTNKDLQNSTMKTKDWATKTTLKTGMLRKDSCSTSDIRRATVKRHEHHLI